MSKIGSLMSWFRVNPLKAFSLVLIILIASSVAVYSYSVLLSTPAMGPRVSIISPPVEFSIQLDKTEFLQGENITIRFYLKNISNKTITIWRPHIYWLPQPENRSGIIHFDFCVLDANGTMGYQWTYGRFAAAAIYTFSLNPSEQISQEIIWNQYTDHPAYAQVPKGVYFIRGIFEFRIDDAPFPLSTL